MFMAGKHHTNICFINDKPCQTFTQGFYVRCQGSFTCRIQTVMHQKNCPAVAVIIQRPLDEGLMLFNVCTVGIDADKQHIIILKVKIRLIRIIRQTKVTEVVCIFVMVSSYRSNRNGMFFCKQMKLLCSSKCIRNSIHLVTHTDDHCRKWI